MIRKPSAGGLPAELTSFIGRTEELRQLRDLLASSRLVTVMGVGGSGKTRLALRLAAEVAREFRHGVVLVELAPLAEASAVPQAILQALGSGDLVGPATEGAVIAAVRDADLLLLLDNCEHVADGCAALVERLLTEADAVRVLATSREPLEAQGETTFALAPLRLPPAGVRHTAKNVDGYEAIELFVERARAARPGFAIDDAGADTVVELCRRLDGLPLAIELAAARMRSMSSAEILDHLDDRFALLRRGRSHGPSRQQTLRATLEWSHNMLSADERVLFRRLAVFAGGWTIDDAEHVAGGDPLIRDRVIAVHARVVERSLVVAEPASPGPSRYRLLETMREYAFERLDEAGEVERVRGAHLEHFVAVAEAYDVERRTRGSDAGLEMLATNRDNLRAALDWAKATDAECALRLTGLLDDFWRMISAAEGWQQLQETLAAAARDSPHRLRALLTAGMLAAYIPAYAEGTGLLREASSAARRCGDDLSEAWAQLWLGRIAFFSGDPRKANDHLSTALVAHERLDSPLGVARSLSLLGLLRTLILGDRDDGVSKLERATVLAHDIGDSWGEGYAQMMLGLCAAEVGDVARATSSCRIALATPALGPLLGVPMLAMAEATVGRDPSRAARLLGAADGHFERTRTVTPPFLSERSDSVRRRMVEVIGSDAAMRAWEDGRRMTAAEATEYALGESLASDRAGSAVVSKREALIARLVAHGRTNREIAATLQLSVRTVESHLNHILTKLALRNRTEIAAWANANLADIET